MENIVERYFTELAQIRSTGASVPETSFYPPLEGLLSDIGKTLSPKVKCVINLTNRGAGIPDGGFFTADQFNRRARPTGQVNDPFQAQIPSRGVMEVKSPKEDLEVVLASGQVEKYWQHYGLVLVTNLRSFVLLGKAQDGSPRRLESLVLAQSEAEFWQLVRNPHAAASRHGERLEEYLKRVLLHRAPLESPQDVAALLASYAHDARVRIEAGQLPALASLRQGLEEALGVKFEGTKGEHFFRSTLVQTLFYGIFSAWVLWSRRRVKGKTFASALKETPAAWSQDGPFDWKAAPYLLRVPMLRALFVQVADPDRLGALDLVEVLEWTSAALNRVDPSQFFKSFDEGHAVQYFYEPFLQAFDPELRKDLGVWYTPDEIVTYQVERVDAVLRSELGVADGLADPQVVVLDPCCGTGAYLRAVLRRIAATLKERGGDALVGQDLKRAALERVFGFEIMPAPFVIAHLQIGLELETLGAPLSDKSDPPERAGIYLTNALTGWEPPKEKPKRLAFPGFDEERDAAGRVKQQKPILVILGNPPYNAFAGVSPQEEDGLVEVYKKGLVTDWNIKKFNLDDLYVRFFRLAEKRVAEHGGRGVVSFISNFSYLSDPSFVVARRRFLDQFDAIWIDCLNGDSRETGKLTPEGKPDPSVFSTPWNREGIRVGTAIGLMVKRGGTTPGDAVVRFRHFWGTEKREELLASSAGAEFDRQYLKSLPRRENRWSLRPEVVSDKYRTWPSIAEFPCVKPMLGILDNRQEALISVDRDDIAKRAQQYLDPSVPWEEVGRTVPKLARDYARFDAKSARAKILSVEPFSDSNIRKVMMRPMDQRWCYYTGVRPIWTETRPNYVAQCWSGNSALVTRLSSNATPAGSPFLWTSLVGMQHALNTDAYYLPVRISTGAATAKEAGQELFARTTVEPIRSANLSAAIIKYLSTIGVAHPGLDQTVAELPWLHALAIGYSPTYLTENADGIRQNWPRIPLPATKEALLASADLGRQLASLLDPEVPVLGVTTGTLQEDLKAIGVFQCLDGKRAADPEAGDLDLTAGWGHAGKEGVTMPGKGRVVMRSDGALDICLNDRTCWRNIPQEVWDYTIGGYQVLKKWLSYRDKSLLGRSLSTDEVRYFTEVARRLAAIVAMQPAFDDNYWQIAARPYDWKD